MSRGIDKGIDKVTIAILNWNGRRHLEACLEALDRQADPGVEWEVSILDNDSSDDSWNWLEEHWPAGRRLGSGGRTAAVRRERAECNLGFCAGNNRLVASTDADAVALLNNDTRPRPEWLGGLVDSLAGAPKDVAAVAGLILDWEGERLDFAKGAMTFDGHAFQRGYHQPIGAVELPEPGAELPFACGGNLLIRRHSFLDAGGFDEEFFAYLEDVDLGWRLWSGGERVIAAPEAVVHHRSMASSDALGMYNRGFLFERNAYLTAYKNYQPDLWEQMMPVVLLTLISRTQTMLLENNPSAAALALDPYHPEQSPLVTGVAAAPAPGAFQKWRHLGTAESLRRALRRLRRELARRLDPDPVGVAVGAPRLEDPRTVAQFRVLSYLLANLDSAAQRRARVQLRRQRSDRELFERFPLLIVPTYPGDERLFASAAFASWLPGDLRFERLSLADLMA